MPSQHLVDQLEIIVHRNKQLARRQELFDQDATCRTCTARIEHVEDCANMKLADGTEFLQHTACFQMWLNQSALRYFGRAS